MRMNVPLALGGGRANQHEGVTSGPTRRTFPRKEAKVHGQSGQRKRLHLTTNEKHTNLHKSEVSFSVTLVKLFKIGTALNVGRTHW